MPFPKTIELLKKYDLGHPVEEVSPHGISTIGYLRVFGSQGPLFMPWPSEVDAHEIFSVYASELAPVKANVDLAVNEEVMRQWIINLVEYCRNISATHGFHERGDTMRGDMKAIESARKAEVISAEIAADVQEVYTDYLNTRLLLIVSEVTEAQDELRSGKTVEDVYYDEAKPGKPEGFLSELVDVLVRAFDLAGELEVADEFASMFIEKTVYNASRPYKHGRKF